jgi:hypothetical protein
MITNNRVAMKRPRQYRREEGSRRSMPTLQLGSWSIEYDAEATESCVHAISSGAPEECGCADCQRFAAARSFAYPASFVALLRTLGTQPKSETEIFYCGEVSPRRHRYGGWFHVVGRLIARPDAKATPRLHYEPLEAPLEIGFTNSRDLAPEAFAGHQLLQVEFVTEVWS